MKWLSAEIYAVLRSTIPGVERSRAAVLPATLSWVLTPTDIFSLSRALMQIVADLVTRAVHSNRQS